MLKFKINRRIIAGGVLLTSHWAGGVKKLKG